MPESLYSMTLSALDTAVLSLVQCVPSPCRVPFKDGFVFRHVERLPAQAIVQKLSRLPSGLRAASLLLAHGLFQELGALQRILDEVGEDIHFLSLAVLSGQTEGVHQEFLDSFFAEEFDFATGKPSLQDRPMVSRRRIRASIANSHLGTPDPSGHIDVSRTIAKAYSGYVHAASAQIMDSYAGDPPRFHTSGMSGTIREEEHRHDIRNYYYRSVMAGAFAAKALNDEQVFGVLFEISQEYERRMGLDPRCARTVSE